MNPIRSLLVALLVCLAGLGSEAAAQDPNFAPVGPFVFLVDDRVSLKPDGSYLFQHTDGGLIFEAQIAPDIRIVDNFGRSLDRVLDPERPRVFAYSVFGTFLTRLRMFNETSNPVRTPSYMPKATIQLAWLIDAIPFGHHSNGQNGCLFVQQTRIDDECEPEDPVVVGPEDINTENGSFSTNYIRLGLEYRRLYPNGDDPNDLRAITRREWGVGGSIELNPTGYVGGSISDTLKPLYGATRFRIAGDIAVGNWRAPIPLLDRVNCGRAWVDGSLMFIQDAAPIVDDVAVAVEAACLPDRWGGSGLFIRYYHGQDYYNAAFMENISRLQFGVTFMQAKFLAFPKR